ncbi:hypothetical protein BT96DRAFT_989830 [Gymnopus androsaceus JB14]|uniref:Uncharacterized protein n=1 Tax=Gymnopus androsaceus JB14 TaxID=1447944 RepID=A0A6A4HZ67_9AGAR|nr:hypothetical protein BT96DRAFT_989830 [Gymnopus androsaceus JB14]
MSQFREHLRTCILAYAAMSWPLLGIFLDWKTAEYKVLLLACSFMQSYAPFMLLVLGRPSPTRLLAPTCCFMYCYAGSGWFQVGPVALSLAELDQAHLMYFAGSFIFAVAMALWDASYVAALDANSLARKCASEEV